MSRYGYLEVFQGVPWNSRYRESTVLQSSLLVIQAYWPFNDGAVYHVDLGTETEINLPSQSNVWVFAGTYTWNFLIDFYNSDKLSYGNWPRGTCSGPYSLGILFL